MELRPADRLILLMLSEIYDALKIRGEVDTKFVRGALFGGHDWAFDWDMSGIVGIEPKGLGVVNRVADILDMHSQCEAAFGRLSPAEQAQVADADDLQFGGFDGNHESDFLSVANFLIDDMNRWTEFKSRPRNSHCSTVPKALRMVEKFKEIQASKGLGFRGAYNAEELQVIASA